MMLLDPSQFLQHSLKYSLLLDSLPIKVHVQ